MEGISNLNSKPAIYSDFDQDKASYSGLEQPHCTDLPLADAGYTLQNAREHFHVACANCFYLCIYIYHLSGSLYILFHLLFILSFTFLSYHLSRSFYIIFFVLIYLQHCRSCNVCSISCPATSRLPFTLNPPGHNLLIIFCGKKASAVAFKMTHTLDLRNVDLRPEFVRFWLGQIKTYRAGDWFSKERSSLGDLQRLDEAFFGPADQLKWVYVPQFKVTL